MTGTLPRTLARTRLRLVVYSSHCIAYRRGGQCAEIAVNTAPLCRISQTAVAM